MLPSWEVNQATSRTSPVPHQCIPERLPQSLAQSSPSVNIYCMKEAGSQRIACASGRQSKEMIAVYYMVLSRKRGWQTLKLTECSQFYPSRLPWGQGVPAGREWQTELKKWRCVCLRGLVSRILPLHAASLLVVPEALARCCWGRRKQEGAQSAGLFLLEQEGQPEAYCLSQDWWGAAWGWNVWRKVSGSGACWAGVMLVQGKECLLHWMGVFPAWGHMAKNS